MEEVRPQHNDLPTVGPGAALQGTPVNCLPPALQLLAHPQSSAPQHHLFKQLVLFIGSREREKEEWVILLLHALIGCFLHVL